MELKAYAKRNLPAASAPEVAKAVDEIQFRAEFRKRLASQLNAWIDGKNVAYTSVITDHELLLTVLRRRDPQAHWNHRRINEAVFAEKRLRYILRSICQQRDSKKVFFFFAKLISSLRAACCRSPGLDSVCGIQQIL